MPITLQWYNDEKRILIQEFTGNWSLDEYYPIIDESFTRAEASPYTIFMISDHTNNTSPPTRLLSIAGYMNKRTSDNTQLQIVIGANTFIKTLAKIGEKFAPKATKDLRWVNTFDEALNLIENYETA